MVERETVIDKESGNEIINKRYCETQEKCKHKRKY